MASARPSVTVRQRHAPANRQTSRTHLFLMDGPPSLDNADACGAGLVGQSDDAVSTIGTERFRNQRPLCYHACELRQEYSEQGASGPSRSRMGACGPGRAHPGPKGEAGFGLCADGISRGTGHASSEGLPALAAASDPRAEAEAVNGSFQSRQRLSSAAAARYAALRCEAGKPLMTHGIVGRAVRQLGKLDTPIATSCLRTACEPASAGRLIKMWVSQEISVR